jgi:hypothetical protein
LILLINEVDFIIQKQIKKIKDDEIKQLFATQLYFKAKNNSSMLMTTFDNLLNESNVKEKDLRQFVIDWNKIMQDLLLLIDTEDLSAPVIYSLKGNPLTSGVLGLFSVLIDKEKAPSLIMYTIGADYEKLSKLINKYLDITVYSKKFPEGISQIYHKLSNSKEEKLRFIEKFWDDVLYMGCIGITRKDMKIIYHQMVIKAYYDEKIEEKLFLIGDPLSVGYEIYDFNEIYYYMKKNNAEINIIEILKDKETKKNNESLLISSNIKKYLEDEIKKQKHFKLQEIIISDDEDDDKNLNKNIEKIEKIEEKNKITENQILKNEKYFNKLINENSEIKIQLSDSHENILNLKNSEIIVNENKKRMISIKKKNRSSRSLDSSNRVEIISNLNKLFINEKTNEEELSEDKDSINNENKSDSIRNDEIKLNENFQFNNGNKIDEIKSNENKNDETKSNDNRNDETKSNENKNDETKSNENKNDEKKEIFFLKEIKNKRRSISTKQRREEIKSPRDDMDDENFSNFKKTLVGPKTPRENDPVNINDSEIKQKKNLFKKNVTKLNTIISLLNGEVENPSKEIDQAIEILKFMKEINEKISQLKTPLKAGYLMKKVKFGWKKLWYLIRNDGLACYLDKTNIKDGLKEIELIQTNEIIGVQDKEDDDLIFNIITSETIVVLKAESSDLKNIWKNEILNLIESEKN